jgi:biotin carboxyl carrier protein
VSELDVRALGRGRFVVVRDGEQHVAHAAESVEGTWVHLDGQVFLVPRADRSTREGARHHPADARLEAPMPATVVSVHVEAGQTVLSGDVLVTLEAMKMELPIRAPRAGRVATVACRAGELVAPGRPLVTLDEPPSPQGPAGS